MSTPSRFLRSLALASLGVLATSAPALAATHYIQVRASDNTPGATNVTYTVAFGSGRGGANTPGNSIVITFPNGWNLTGLSTTAVDWGLNLGPGDTTTVSTVGIAGQTVTLTLTNAGSQAGVAGAFDGVTTDRNWYIVYFPRTTQGSSQTGSGLGGRITNPGSLTSGQVTLATQNDGAQNDGSGLLATGTISAQNGGFPAITNVPYVVTWLQPSLAQNATHGILQNESVFLTFPVAGAFPNAGSPLANSPATFAVDNTGGQFTTATHWASNNGGGITYGFTTVTAPDVNNQTVLTYPNAAAGTTIVARGATATVFCPPTVRADGGGGGINNPTTPGTYYFRFRTIDTGPTNGGTGNFAVTDFALPFTLAVGAMNSSKITVAPGNVIVGSGTSYSVSFTTDAPIPANGRIRIAFPANTDASAITLTDVSANGPAGLSIASLNVLSPTLIELVQSGASSVPPGSFDVTLGRLGGNLVKNPTTIGSGYTLTITLTDSAANPIDAGTSPAYPAGSGFVGTDLSNLTNGAPSTLVANAPSNWTFNFNSPSTIRNGDAIVLTFPADTNLAAVVGGDVAVPAFTSSTVGVSGQTLTITNTGATAPAGPYSVTISNLHVTNPTITGAYSVLAKVVVGATNIDPSSPGGTDAFPAFTIQGGPLGGPAITGPTPSTSATAALYSMSFTLNSQLPANGLINLTFPAGTTLLQGAYTVGTDVTTSGNITISSANASGSVLSLANNASPVAAGQTIVIQVTTATGKVTNPATVSPGGVPSYTIGLATATSLAAPIDSGTTPLYAITGSQVGTITVTPTNAAPGQQSAYTISFLTRSTLPKDGKVEVRFKRTGDPTGTGASTSNFTFPTSGPSPVTIQSWAGADDTVYAAPGVSGLTNQIVTFTRSNTGTPAAPGVMRITFNPVTNDAVAGTYYVDIRTLDTNNVVIDSFNNDSASPFTLSSNPFGTITVTPSNTAAVAANVTYTLAITLPTTGGLTTNGASTDALEIDFPAGFDLSGLKVAGIAIPASSSGPPAVNNNATKGASVVTGLGWFTNSSGIGTPTSFSIGKDVGALPLKLWLQSDGSAVAPIPGGTVLTIVLQGIGNAQPGSYQLSCSVIHTNSNGQAFNTGPAFAGPTASSPFTIIDRNLQGLAVTAISPNNQTTTASTYTVQFTTRQTIPTSGKIRLDWGSATGFTVGGPLSETVSWLGSGSLTSQFSSIATVGTAIVITNSGAPVTSATLIVTVGTVTNTNVVGTWPVKVATTDGVADLETGTTSFQIVGGPLTGVGDVPGSNVTVATSTHAISFTTRSFFPSNGIVVVNFPAGFDLTAVRTADVSWFSPPGVGIASVVTTSKTSIRITRNGTGGSFNGATACTINIANVKNTAVVGTGWAVQVATFDNSSNAIDTLTTATGTFSTVGASMTGVVDLPSPNRAGEPATHTVSFTTHSTLPADGAVLIDFGVVGNPDTFDLTNVPTTPSSFTWIGIDGTFSVAKTATTIKLTRSNNGTATAPGPLSIAIPNVLNAATPSAGYTVQVSTSKGVNPVDPVTPSSAVTIAPGVVSSVLDGASGSSLAAGFVGAQHVVTFSTNSVLPTSGQVAITFNTAGYDLANVVTSSIAWTVNGTGIAFTLTKVGSTLTLTNASGGPVPAGSYSITINNITNTTTTGAQTVSAVLKAATGGNPNETNVAASANFTIGTSPLTNVTHAPNSSVAGQAVAHVVTFTTTSIVPQTGFIDVTFPVGFNATGGTPSITPVVTGTFSNPTPNVLRFTPTAANVAPGTFTIADTAVVNSTTIQSYTVSVATDTPGATIIQGPTPSSPADNIVGGTLSSVALAPSPATASAITTYTLTFTTVSDFPTDANVSLTIQGFDLTTVPSVQSWKANGVTLDGAFTLSATGNNLLIQRTGGTFTGPAGTMSIQVNSVPNSTVTGNHTITVQTQTPTGTVLDAAASGTLVLQGSALTGPASGKPQLTPNPNTAGAANVTHTVTFTTNSTLPKNGRVVISYTAASDNFSIAPLTTVANPAGYGWIGVDGGFTVTAAGSTITLERTGTGNDTAPVTMAITIPVVENAPTPQSYTVSVATQTNGGAATIDPSTLSQPFAIVVAPVTNVTDAPSSTTAGASNVTHTFTFTTPATIPPSGRVRVVFDASSYDLSQFRLADISWNGGAIAASAITTTTTTIDITAPITTITAPGTFTIAVPKIGNTFTQGSHTVSVSVFTPLSGTNATEAGPGVSAAFNITIQAIQSFDPPVLSSRVAGAVGVSYLVSFVNAATIPTNAFVDLGLPADQSIWQVTSTANASITGLVVTSSNLQSDTTSGTAYVNVTRGVGTVTVDVFSDAARTVHVATSVATAIDPRGTTVTLTPFGGGTIAGTCVLPYVNASDNTLVATLTGFQWGHSGPVSAQRQAILAGNLLRLQNLGPPLVSGISSIITLTAVTNSEAPGSKSLSARTILPDGVTTLEGQASRTYSIVGAPLSGPAGTPEVAPDVTLLNSDKTLVASRYAVRFSTESAIPAGGRLQLTFPAGFTISSPQVATWTTVARSGPNDAYPASNPTGSIGVVTTAISAQTISLIVPVKVPAGHHRVVVDGIQNQALPGNYTATLQTLDPSFVALDPPGVVPNTSTAWAINGQTLAAPTVTLNPSQTGKPSSHTIQFTTKSQIPANGKLVITYANGDAVAAGRFNVATITTVTWAGIDGSISVTTSGGVVTITRNNDGTPTSPAAHSVTLVGVTNGARVVNPPTPVPANADNLSLATVFASGTPIDQSLARSLQVTQGTVSGVAINSPSAATTNSVTPYDVSFTTESILPQAGQIQVTFPPGTTFTGGLSVVQMTVPGTLGAPGLATASNVLTITNNGGADINPGLWRLVVNGVQNTPTTGSYTLSVSTLSGTTIDASATSAGSVQIVGGALSGASVSNGSQTVGATTSYTLQLTTSSQIPANGRVEASFPSGFGLPGSPVVTWTAGAAVPHTVAVVGQTILITNTSGAPIAPGAETIVINGIANTTSAHVPSTTYALPVVDTATSSGTVIDVTNNFGSFQIVPAGLTGVTDTPTPSGANVPQATHTITFQQSTNLPKDGVVTLVFPASFTIAAVPSVTWAGINGGFSVTVAGSTVTLRRDGTGADTSPTTHSIAILGITNSGIVAATHTVSVTPRDFANNAIETTASTQPFAITNTSFTNVSDAPNPATTNNTATHTVVFTTVGVVRPGNVLDLQLLDANFNVSAVTTASIAWTSPSGPVSGNSLTVPSSGSQNVLRIVYGGVAVLASGTHQLVIGNIVNTSTIGNATITPTLWLSNPPSPPAIAGPTASPPFAISGAQLGGVTATPFPGSDIANETSVAYTFQFTNVAPVPALGKVSVRFQNLGGSDPFNFNTTSPTAPILISWTFNGTPVDAGTPPVLSEPDSQSLLFTRQDPLGAGLGPGTHVIKIYRMGQNHPTAATNHTVQIATLTPVNAVVEGPTSSAGFTLKGGAAGSVAISLTSTTSGAQATQTISFQTGSTLPVDGEIVIAYDPTQPPLLANWSLPGAGTASSDVGTISSFTFNAGTQTLTLQRDGTGLPAPPGAHTLTLAGFKNSTREHVGNAHFIRLSTLTSGGATIDAPSSSPTFALAPGPLVVQTYTLTPNAASASAAHVTTFTTTSNVASDARFQLVTSDSGFNFATATAPQLTTGAGTEALTVESAVGNLLVLVRQAGRPELLPGSCQISLQTVTNTPTSTGGAASDSTQIAMNLGPQFGASPQPAVDGPGVSPPYQVTGGPVTIAKFTLAAGAYLNRQVFPTVSTLQLFDASGNASRNTRSGSITIGLAAGGGAIVAGAVIPASAFDPNTATADLNALGVTYGGPSGAITLKATDGAFNLATLGSASISMQPGSLTRLDWVTAGAQLVGKTFTGTVHVRAFDQDSNLGAQLPVQGIRFVAPAGTLSGLSFPGNVTGSFPGGTAALEGVATYTGLSGNVTITGEVANGPPGTPITNSGANTIVINPGDAVQAQWSGVTAAAQRVDTPIQNNVAVTMLDAGNNPTSRVGGFVRIRATTIPASNQPGYAAHTLTVVNNTTAPSYAGGDPNIVYFDLAPAEFNGGTVGQVVLKNRLQWGGFVSPPSVTFTTEPVDSIAFIASRARPGTNATQLVDGAGTFSGVQPGWVVLDTTNGCRAVVLSVSAVFDTITFEAPGPTLGLSFNPGDTYEVRKANPSFPTTDVSTGQPPRLNFSFGRVAALDFQSSLPSPVVVGQPLGGGAVTARDRFGNLTNDVAPAVSLTLAAVPGFPPADMAVPLLANAVLVPASFSGITTGVATLANVVYNGTAGTVRLGGVVSVADISTNSNPFSEVPGAPVWADWQAFGPSSQQNDQLFAAATPSARVRVFDVGGNLTDDTGPGRSGYTLALAVQQANPNATANPGATNVLTGTGASAGTGVRDVTGVKFTGQTGSMVLLAQANGANLANRTTQTASARTIAVTPGVSDHYQWDLDPSAPQKPGVALNGAVYRLIAKDVSDNVLVDYTTQGTTPNVKVTFGPPIPSGSPTIALPASPPAATATPADEGPGTSVTFGKGTFLNGVCDISSLVYSGITGNVFLVTQGAPKPDQTFTAVNNPSNKILFSSGTLDHFDFTPGWTSQAQANDSPFNNSISGQIMRLTAKDSGKNPLTDATQYRNSFFFPYQVKVAGHTVGAVDATGLVLTDSTAFNFGASGVIPGDKVMDRSDGNAIGVITVVNGNQLTVNALTTGPRSKFLVSDQFDVVGRVGDILTKNNFGPTAHFEVVETQLNEHFDPALPTPATMDILGAKFAGTFPNAGFRYKGPIPASGKIRIIPATNGGATDVKATVADVPTLIDITIVPGTLASFAWNAGSTQQDAIAFVGTSLTLTALDVSLNVITSYSTTGFPVNVLAAAGAANQVRHGKATSTDGASPQTTLHDANAPFAGLSLSPQLYVHDVSQGVTARLIAVPDPTTLITAPLPLNKIFSTNDEYIVDASPVLPSVTFNAFGSGNVLDRTAFTNGVANVASSGTNPAGLVYRGLANGVLVSLFASANGVSANTGGGFTITMNPGTASALRAVFTSVSPVTGAFVAESLVEGDSSVAGRVANFLDPQPSGTTRDVRLRVSVVDVDNNIVVGQTGTVALADADPNALQPASAALAGGSATFVLTGQTAPRTVFAAPWNLTASFGGLANEVRRVLVQTDGVQRLAFMFPRDVAIGTAGAGTTAATLVDVTKNFVALGVQPGWVVVDQSDANSTGASAFAYGVVTALTATTLSTGGLAGGTANALAPGHTYLVTPQYHLDGQLDPVGVQHVGIVGLQEQLVAGVSRPKGLQVLALDSGNNMVPVSGPTVVVKDDDVHDGIGGIAPAAGGGTALTFGGSGSVAIAPYQPRTAAAPVVPPTALPRHNLTITPSGFGAGVLAVSDSFQVIPGAAAQTLIVLPGQALDPGGTALTGAPADQSANVAFTANVAATDAVFNGVNNASTVSLALSAGANGTITPSVTLNAGSASIPSILCRKAQPAATGWLVTPSGGPGTQVPSSPIQVLPGLAAQTVVLVSGPIASGNAQTLAAGQTTLGAAVVTTPAGPLRAIAGVGNVPVQVAIVDQVFNPVLVTAMSGAAKAAASSLRLDTTDPVNPTVLGVSCVNGPAFGALGPTAVGNASVSLTRAQLQHTIVVNAASAQPILVAGSQTDYASTPIRVDPGAATQVIVLLPGEKLNTGAGSLGAAVPPAVPPFTAIESIPFTVLALAVDGFFNVDWSFNGQITQVRTDDFSNHVGRLAQSISAEGAPSTITAGQIHLSDLQGRDLGAQVFGDATTGDSIALAIAAKIQSLKLDASTNLFDARFFPEFRRYLLLDGQPAALSPVPANSTLRVSSPDSGSPSTGVSLRMGAGFAGVNGSAEAPGLQNGTSLLPSTGNPDVFSNGVAAFRIVHNNTGNHSTIALSGLATNSPSNTYQVNPPTFSILSVTAETDGSGAITNARIVFSLPINLNTVQTAAPNFSLRLMNGPNVVKSITGNNASVLTTVQASDTIELTFGGSIPGTTAANLVLAYTQPALSPLAADANLGGTVLASTTIPIDPPGVVTDGAQPVLLSVTPYDLDGNGGMERVTFTWSEPVQILSGRGFSASGFGAVTSLTAGSTLALSLDGDPPITVTFPQSVTGGANVAAALRALVRAVTPANPARKRAYAAFDCSYDVANGRYTLRSGTSVAWNGSIYALGHTSSAVTIAAAGSGDAAPALLLGTANRGFERAGRGSGQLGQSIGAATIATTTMTAGVNDQLAFRVNGTPVRTISLLSQNGATIADFGSRVAAAIQDKFRQLKAQNPTFQKTFDDFTCFYDTTLNRLVLLTGTEGSGAAIHIVSGSEAGAPGSQDAAPLLGLGPANGGREVAGANNATLGLEDLILLRNDGGKNLIAGLGPSAISISGPTITINLPNDPANGTATPRFAWIDDGSGGFVADLATVPNVATSPVTNVPQIGAAQLAVVLDNDATPGDGNLRLSPGDVTLDASQSLPPLQASGGNVTYLWTQPSPGTDPAAITIQNASMPVAKALAMLKPGTYHLQLTLTITNAAGAPLPNALTDGLGRVIRQFTVTVTNDPPISLPGSNRIVTGPVTLDGSASFDPNGGAITYLWTAQTATGAAVPASAFSDPTLAKPLFTPPATGTFTLTLFVAKAPAVPIPDPLKTPPPSSASILVTFANGSAVPPSADPGLPLTVRIGTPAQLDGSASASASGALAFSWTVLAGPAPVVLSNAASATPSFVPPAPGIYTIQLVVADSIGIRSAPRTVDVIALDDQSATPRIPPVARPRALGLTVAAFLPPATTQKPDSVTFDDGTKAPVQFFTLVGATPPTADQTKGLTALPVYTGTTLTGTGWVLVPTGAAMTGLTLVGGATAPILSFAHAGDVVVFDATRSQSAAGVVQQTSWVQTGGPFVFSSRQGAVFSQAVPTAGTYDFQATVTDDTGLHSEPKALRVFVLPTGATGQGPPTATATGPASVVLGSQATLSAKSSVTRAPGAVAFAWTQLGGPLVALAGTGDTVTFTPTVAGVYEFEVRVTDSNGVFDTADVFVAAGTKGAPVVTPAKVPGATIAPGQKSTTLSLSASATSPSGKQLVYTWSQVDGSPVFVDTTSSSAAPKVTVTVPGHYAFLVQASDGTQKSAPVLVEAVVAGGQDSPIVQGGGMAKSSSGCAVAGGQAPATALPWALALLLAVLGRARRRTRRCEAGGFAGGAQ